jgi:hypothetical protein
MCPQTPLIDSIIQATVAWFIKEVENIFNATLKYCLIKPLMIDQINSISSNVSANEEIEFTMFLHS